MNNNSLNWTFDTVADTYEKMRPRYVDELYQTIFDYAPINNTSRVVEIGIGGGQATLPFLKTGCNLTAVITVKTSAKYAVRNLKVIRTFLRFRESLKMLSLTVNMT